ncbi:hypothetical protein [Flavobacterium sp.]|uniref:hypothetical protein n=1 Tax=Flavobacterium sp. TaxID=239 RepID=UPI003D6BEBC6
MNTFRKIKPFIILIGFGLSILANRSVLNGNKMTALVGAICFSSVIVFYAIEAYNNIKNYQKGKTK